MRLLNLVPVSKLGCTSVRKVPECSYVASRFLSIRTPLELYFSCPQPPDPATVRPQAVLQDAMQNISEKWAKGGMDYIYACSQLKAIRQDIVVRSAVLTIVLAK